MMKPEDIPQSYRDMWKKKPATSERTVEYLWVWEQLPEPPGKVLDVGCCETNFAYELAKHGFEVDAVDIRPYHLKHPNLNTFQMDIFGFSSQEPYDVTVAISTLEHLGLNHYGNKRLYEKGWLRGIQHMYDLTRKYGYVLLTMPYGKQIGGFNWIYTPSKDDIFGVEMIFPNVETTYYAFMEKSWQEVSHKIAVLKKGLPKGFPTSIVCIKIRKNVEFGSEKRYISKVFE